MSAARPAAPDDPAALRSPAQVRFFTAAMERAVRRDLHAVRIAWPGVPALPDARPVVLYCNHPAWWDAAVLAVLAARLFPSRRAFGPVDAAAMQRYGFMRRVGLFAVGQDGAARDTAHFLRTGRALLAQPDVLFAITPQGRFSDPRERPLRLRPGLAALLARSPPVTVLPLALDYPFWTERTPEALVRFGTPVALGGHAPVGAIAALQQQLEAALAATLDALAADAIAKDPRRFTTLVSGRAGVGGVYDGWRRLRAWAGGRRFVAAHGAEAEP